jgi:predicted dehydrogenase
MDVADAALIATPPATHADLARRCLAAGWHVLVEKPLATNLADAREVVRRAAQVDRRVAVGFNRRFRPSWRTARRLLGAAAYGDAHLTLVFDTRAWGTTSALDDEAAAVAGLLDDVAPHQVDLLAYLFDSPIDRVRAEQVRFLRGRSVELMAAVELASGITVRCRVAHMPEHAERLEATALGRKLVADPHDARCVGSWTDLSHLLGPLRTKLAHVGSRLAGRPTPTTNSFIAQLRSFATAVRNGAAGDLADGTVGLAACAAADAIRSSVHGGGAWIDVPREVP